MSSIQYGIKIVREKVGEHGYAVCCEIDVPGYPPSVQDMLVGMIGRAIRGEVKKIHNLAFTDEATFKERVDEIQKKCYELANEVIEKKMESDQLKKDLGLPVEEQQIGKPDNPPAKED